MSERKKRVFHTADFKAKVGLEEIQSDKTINEIAHPCCFIRSLSRTHNYHSAFSAKQLKILCVLTQSMFRDMTPLIYTT